MTDTILTSPETESIKSRNQEILDFLNQGKTPVLPFESALLQEKLALLTEEQARRGRLMQEAMSQSSETWHDNAPADALAAQSRTATEQVAGIKQTVDAAIEVSYPSEVERVVTLGSLVFVRFGQGDACPVFISGSVRDVSDIKEISVPDDSEVVTLQSPLGRAMLDTREGQLVSYEVRGRDMTVEVGEVFQLQP